jgi:hypothetical protein
MVEYSRAEVVDTIIETLELIPNANTLAEHCS